MLEESKANAYIILSAVSEDIQASLTLTGQDSRDSFSSRYGTLSGRRRKHLANISACSLGHQLDVSFNVFLR